MHAIRHFLYQLFHDEKQKPSMGRMLLVAWSTNIMVMMWRHPELNNAIWALNGSIETALIAWVGGSRIAQYLGPQVGAVGSAIANAIRKGRDAEQALEPTKEA